MLEDIKAFSWKFLSFILFLELWTDINNFEFFFFYNAMKHFDELSLETEKKRQTPTAVPFQQEVNVWVYFIFFFAFINFNEKPFFDYVCEHIYMHTINSFHS